jgi:hydrogenase nickel incorporation protein HypA/HybF
MHEFSLIASIMDMAVASAREHHIDHVTAIELEIGQAAGVVPEALQFAWDSVKKDTLLQHTALLIKNVPLCLKCRTCNSEYRAGELFEVCPECGDFNPEIISGKELRLTAIITG